MFSKGKPTGLTTKDITDIVPEIQILGHYFDIYKVPCVISSPLRTDKNPSLGLYSLDGHRIYYKDFSTKEYGDSFDLIAKYWGLSRDKVLEKINKEIILPNEKLKIGTLVEKTIKGKISYSKDVDLNVKVREWKQYDIDYWEQFGISLPWLKFSNTYPISHILVKKENKSYTINADKYAYVYVEFKDNTPTLKIYQPFSETFKWTNKHDGSVWDLWTKLPEKGDNLIITSSRKDALCIWENTGIPACSLQAESYLPKEHVVNILKNRFKNIFVLYDNDFDKPINYGDSYAEDLSRQFDLIKIKLPDELLIKDTSDLCKRDGREQVKKTINKLISNF